MTSTRDSLAELYALDQPEDYYETSLDDFKSGWDALAKLIKEEIYQAETSGHYPYCEELIDQITKLVRE